MTVEPGIVVNVLVYARKTCAARYTASRVLVEEARFFTVPHYVGAKAVQL